MIIRSRALLALSIPMLFLSVLQIIVAQQVLETTATRDFNFGPPFLIMIAGVQALLSVVGIILALVKKNN